MVKQNISLTSLHKFDVKKTSRFMEDVNKRRRIFLWLRSIAKSWFRFWNPDFGFFAIEREIGKRISPPWNPSSRWIFIKKSKSRFHWFPFYCSIGKFEDRCSLELFFKSFFWFPPPPPKKKRKERKFKNTYLSVENTAVFEFCVRLQIRNPDFKI